MENRRQEQLRLDEKQPPVRWLTWPRSSGRARRAPARASRGGRAGGSSQETLDPCPGGTKQVHRGRIGEPDETGCVERFAGCHRDVRLGQ